MAKLVPINPDYNEVVGNRVIPKVNRLQSLEQVREEAARLYRACRRGDVDASDGAKMNTILQHISSPIKAIDIEKRLAEVEKRLIAGGVAGKKVAIGRPTRVA